MAQLDLQYDYRKTHLAPEKGASYDSSFKSIPWRAYLWEQEKKALGYYLNQYFSSKSISHLDFACGTGRVLKFLADKTQQSTGIDISKSMLEIARKTIPQAELIEGDITTGNVLGERKFDLITAFRFFPNAQSELRFDAIRELSSHLTEDGLLVFNNHKNFSSTLYSLGRLMDKHPMTMSMSQVRELLDSANLKIVEAQGIGVLPATDNHMLMPQWMHYLADRTADLIGLRQILAQNIIFVCQRKDVDRNA